MTDTKTTRAYKAWTDQEDHLLKTLLDEGKQAKEIGVILGRSAGTVTMRKRRLGLVEWATTCGNCGTPIEQPRNGRPKKYCGTVCGNAVAAAKRLAEAAARIEQRDWTCAAHDCTNQVPKEHPRRRYCSPKCRGRTHQLSKVYLRNLLKEATS